MPSGQLRVLSRLNQCPALKGIKTRDDLAHRLFRLARLNQCPALKGIKTYHVLG